MGHTARDEVVHPVGSQEQVWMLRLPVILMGARFCVFPSHLTQVTWAQCLHSPSVSLQGNHV